MKPNIYLTSLHLKYGGCERTITLLANGLVRRGYNVTILCTYNFGTPAYPLDPSVNITYLLNRLPNREALSRALKNKRPLSLIREGISAAITLYLKKYSLKRALKKIEDGVVIASRDLDVCIANRHLKKSVRLFAQIHYDPFTDEKLLKHLSNAYNSCEKIIVLLPSLGNRLKQLDIPATIKSKITSIPNFLTDDYISQATQAQPLDRRDKRILGVGRLEKEKGFDLLIDAWAAIAQQHPEWKLSIVGGGSQRHDLENKVKNLGINNQCEFLGVKNEAELMDLYASSRIFALPSRNEGFGIVLLEAAAFGLPSVSFDIHGGPEELITHEINGLKAITVDDYSHALQRLINDPALADACGRNNQQRVRNYSESAVIDQWLTLLSAPTRI